jgi:hypothetical protein
MPHAFRSRFCVRFLAAACGDVVWFCLCSLICPSQLLGARPRAVQPPIVRGWGHAPFPSTECLCNVRPVCNGTY